MILTDKIEVKLSNRNITYYQQFYPDIKSGDIIEIDIINLPKGSKQIIDVICDKCGKEIKMMYKTYIYITKNNKYYCSDCKYERIKETNLNLYGVENVFQLDDIKEKSKDTCLDKYGSEYYSKTKDYIEKVIKTNNKRYGSKHPMKNKDIKEKSINNKKTPVKESIEKLKETRKNKYSVLFIDGSNRVHHNKYDYSKVEYKNMETKVEIGCLIHGIFNQKPKDHLHGKQGCPKCKTSKGELEIIYFLESNNIKYDYQLYIKGCKSKSGSKLFFDFYLPEHNICIEYDGEQHFQIIEKWGGEEGLKIRKERDEIKNNFCKNNNIKLIRIRYDQDIKKELKQLCY